MYFRGSSPVFIVMRLLPPALRAMLVVAALLAFAAVADARDGREDAPHGQSRSVARAVAVAAGFHVAGVGRCFPRHRAFLPVLVIGALIAGGLSLTPDGAGARPMGYKGDAIAFERHFGAYSEIVLMATDGTEQRNVTSDQAHAARPAWDPPDGNDCPWSQPSPARLLFDSNRGPGGDADIWMLGFDNVARAPVSVSPVTNDDSADETEAAWRDGFDGEVIAYTRNEGGNAEVWVHDLVSGQRLNVSNHSAEDRNADWSPWGGEYLAFESTRAADGGQGTGQREIWIVRIDRTPEGLLQAGTPYLATPGGSPNAEPSWVSFDGLAREPVPVHWLAYTTQERGDSFIDMLEDPFVPFLGAPEVVPLTGGEGGFGAPSWAPDGAGMLYHRQDATGQYDVYAMLPDAANGGILTEGASPLAGGPSNEMNPDWRNFDDCAQMNPRRPRPRPRPRRARAASTPTPSIPTQTPTTPTPSIPTQTPTTSTPPDDRPPPTRPGACTIRAGATRRVLRGTPRRDIICGGARNDLIIGGGGADVIRGGRGRDRLVGGTGNDRIAGGAGPDRVLAGAGKDVVFVRRGGRDAVDGGSGMDTAFTDRNDRVRNVERMRR